MFLSWSFRSWFFSNLNSLLVNRQIGNPSPGAVTGGNSLALTREVNFRYAII